MGIFSRKEKSSSVDNVVYSPINGEIKALSSLNDGVFSEGMLGKGVVVSAPNNIEKVTFVSPVAGELVTAFPTGHAYGIKTESGFEILLHIGIDTVNLEGKGFNSCVKQGQKVKVGTPLVEVDLDYVRKNAPVADAILVVTSMQDIKVFAQQGSTKIGQSLFEIN